ncbi:MAG: 5-oxoprolinase subunit PxpB [Thermoanaerobaculia bacterium]
MRVAWTEVVDGAALVEYPDAVEIAANEAAVALHAALAARPPRGLLDAVPGARTLFLLFDPGLWTLEGLAREIAGAAARPGRSTRERRLLTIPVSYGGDAGPDLAGLAARLGCTERDVIRRHSEADYSVAFIGFAPGFPYLRGLPESLHAPRLPTPRTRVAAGSVGIGGSYTGVYPQETPGGWQLIGRAPVRLFDPAATAPALLRPGDRVRFAPIDAMELLRRASALRPPPPRTPRGPALLRVLAPGLSSSVQGMPRMGLGSSGVPPGGAMDLPGLAAGNASVGNGAGAAGLEVTLVGPELEALADCAIALSGAPVAAELDGTPLAAGEIHVMRKGDRLRLDSTREGARSYLCVEGGLEAAHERGISRRLTAGDVLHRAESVPAPAPSSPTGAPGTPGVLRVVLDRRADLFTDDAAEKLVSATYRVSASSDRRGIRLHGEALARRGAEEFPPEGTALGAIQVPPDGMPILLGPDRPITGGYPRIGTVLPQDWPVAAQAVPGAALRFEIVSRARTVSPGRRHRGG